MYTEHFKKRIFSSTWRISDAQGMIHMKLGLHVACLNVILTILPSCGHICISGFRCRLSVTTSIGTTSPRLPYIIHFCICHESNLTVGIDHIFYQCSGVVDGTRYIMSNTTFRIFVICSGYMQFILSTSIL